MEKQTLVMSHFSTEELDVIKKILPFLPAKIHHVQDQINNFLDNLPEKEKFQRIICDIKNSWVTLYTLASDKEMFQMTLRTQVMSRNKILLHGFGNVHYEDGIICKIIVNTKFRIGALLVPLCVKDDNVRLYEVERLFLQIDELYALLRPNP